MGNEVFHSDMGNADLPEGATAFGKSLNQRLKPNIEQRRSRWQTKLWLVSFVLMPYASYAGLVVMLGLWISALFQRGTQIWRLCLHRGFGWLAVGLLLSSSFALNRGESFLQLTNFLPFFVLFGVLATVPAVVAQPFAKLETLARWLLLSAVPMNLLAVIEYGLKFENVIPKVQALALPNWLMMWLYEVDFGHRAHSLFSHPNMLSAYSVIILGLGLGLFLKGLPLESAAAPLEIGPDVAKATARNWQRAQALAIALCIVTIFCTGSRNGVLIALVLVAIALYAARRHRWVMFAGLSGSGAIAAAVLSLGIGGRSLSLEMLTNDPRIGAWHLAWDMIQQRPWLGWGFAGLRLLYVPESIPGYDIIFHAHNLWLYLASEAGIPVMIGFCMVIGTLYYDGIKAFIQGNLPPGDRAILLGYLLAFTSCLLFSLFDVALFDSRINVISWGLLSALYIMSRSEKAT